MPHCWRSRRAMPCASTCSRASRAIATRTGTATPWAAGAWRDCPGTRADLRLTRPVYEAAIRGSEHDRPEDDPIPGEGAEVVPADVAYQPAHAEEGRNEGNHETDAENADIAGVEERAVLVEIVGAGRDQCRHREKERELGRNAPRQAEQHPADDGRSRARGARDQRNGLR